MVAESQRVEMTETELETADVAGEGAETKKKRGRKPKSTGAGAGPGASNLSPTEALADTAAFREGENELMLARQLGDLLIECAEGKEVGALRAFRQLASFTMENTRDDLPPDEAAERAVAMALKFNNRLSELFYSKVKKQDGSPRVSPFGSRLKVIMQCSQYISEILNRVEDAKERAYDEGKTLMRMQTFSKVLTHVRHFNRVMPVEKILEIGHYRKDKNEQGLPKLGRIYRAISKGLEDLGKYGIDVGPMVTAFEDVIIPQISARDGTAVPADKPVSLAKVALPEETGGAAFAG